MSRKSFSNEQRAPIEIIVISTESATSIQSKTATTQLCDEYKSTFLDLFDDNGDCFRVRDILPDLIIDRLTLLNLSRCNLDHIPKNLDFPNLKVLNLSYNQFRSIPECLETGCGRLEHLDLSHNCLNTFLVELKCVKRIRIVLINNNCLGMVPRWILSIRCCRLQGINYSHNPTVALKYPNITASILHELEKFELRNSNLRTDDISFVKQIFQLKFLDLSNDEGKDEKSNNNIFTNIDSLFETPQWQDTIEILYLNNLNLSSIDTISSMCNLQELYLSNNDLIWLPEKVGHLSNLKILDLSRNRISFLPNKLTDLKNLEILRLAHNVIGLFSGISDLVNLKILDLYCNDLQEFTLDISRIESVDLEQNYFCTDQIENYLNKKNTLRNAYDRLRSDGPREQLKDDYSSDESEIILSSRGSGAGDDDVYSNHSESDFWDRTVPCHNDCTLSDNEWTGEEIIYRKPKCKKPVRYPSLLFVDAVE